jgi:hypothetical protein
LKDIQSVWVSAVVYADRVRQLRAGALKALAVTTDASSDQAFGENGQDWFFANLGLDQTDRVLEFEEIG